MTSPSVTRSSQARHLNPSPRQVEELDERLRLLVHKARFAAAMQRNLELRARNLRCILRTPALWPSGEASEAERAQFRALVGLRYRVLDETRAHSENEP